MVTATSKCMAETLAAEKVELAEAQLAELAEV